MILHSSVGCLASTSTPKLTVARVCAAGLHGQLTVT